MYVVQKTILYTGLIESDIIPFDVSACLESELEPELLPHDAVQWQYLTSIMHVTTDRNADESMQHTVPG